MLWCFVACLFYSDKQLQFEHNYLKMYMPLLCVCQFKVYQLRQINQLILCNGVCVIWNQTTLPHTLELSTTIDHCVIEYVDVTLGYVIYGVAYLSNVKFGKRRTFLQWHFILKYLKRIE